MSVVGDSNGLYLCEKHDFALFVILFEQVRSLIDFPNKIFVFKSYPYVSVMVASKKLLILR